MILIKKNPEPQSWTQYCSTPGVDYAASEDLVKSLLKEQGYLCAYCMRRISCRDRLYKKDGKHYVFTHENHRVEHMLSRENHEDKKLQYSNIVICCPGHIGSEDHCDRRKDSNDISFSPTDAAFIDTIQYSTSGTISSSDAKADEEMNKLLNLNTPLLVKNRAAAYAQVVQMICQQSRGSWQKSDINRYIRKYSSVQSDGKRIEYCGMVLYMLQKKLRQFN